MTGRALLLAIPLLLPGLVILTAGLMRGSLEGSVTPPRTPATTSAPGRAQSIDAAPAEGAAEATGVAQAAFQTESAAKPPLDHRQMRLDYGEWVFQQRCVACHGPDGAGQAGPNLTDRYHLYDHSIRDLLEVIRSGRPERGMPNWSEFLSKDEIFAVTRYVWSIRHTDRPGREPQGSLADPMPNDAP